MRTRVPRKLKLFLNRWFLGRRRIAASSHAADACCTKDGKKEATCASGNTERGTWQCCSGLALRRCRQGTARGFAVSWPFRCSQPQLRRALRRGGPAPFAIRRVVPATVGAAGLQPVALGGIPQETLRSGSALQRRRPTSGRAHSPHRTPPGQASGTAWIDRPRSGW